MKLEGRRVSGGRASAQVLASPAAMSFVGGVDAATGRVTSEDSGIRGEALGGRVLAFPHGKGSTVGSYVLYGLAKRGVGPAAIVNERTDAIVATGCILAGVPLVDSVDVALLATGDSAVVDGDAGIVELPGVETRKVVTAFLRNRGRILVLRRGDGAPTFPGHWSGVSGTLEGRERPLDRVRTEIREETGIRRARLVSRGDLVRGRAGSVVYEIRPFLLDVDTRTVHLDWENSEARWIRPEEIPSLRTVPRLPAAWAAVARTR